MAASGQLPPSDLARIMKLVGGNKTLADAVAQVQREAQQRQATAGPPGAPEGPAAPGSPEAQPGIAAPGAGAEAGAAIPAQPQSVANLLAMVRGGRTMEQAAAG
jgi:hypothetical protein